MTPTPPLTYQFNATEVITDFVKKHHLAVEALTETQLAEAIRQAIASGDFVRCVTQDGKGQNVTYVPFRELGRLGSLYDELLYAVESKHPMETRHETALRYIREREAAKLGDVAAEDVKEPG